MLLAAPASPSSLTVAVGRLAGDLVDAARARTAADAVALAGVGRWTRGGRPAGRGQRRPVVVVAREGDDVTVTVRVGDAVARSGDRRRATPGAGRLTGRAPFAEGRCLHLPP